MNRRSAFLGLALLLTMGGTSPGHAATPAPAPTDAALADVLSAAKWKSQLRLDLQRPIDPRLEKIETAGIEGSGLFRGKVHTVMRPAEIQALSGRLLPGDQLVLAGEDWRDAKFVFEGRGTADAPILIRSEKPGGVVFSGESAVRFHGAHLVVHDLTFRGVTVTRDHAVIFAVGNGEPKPADACLFHRLRFEDCGSPRAEDWPKLHLWLMSMRGSDNTVAHCTFSGMRHIGQMIGAAELPIDGLQRLHILHNRFANRPHLDEQNGYEIIQIGWSGVRAAPSGSLIQGNTFENCDGENEIITLKASDVVVRDNRFLGCQGMLCLRSASRVLVQGNIFDGQGRPDTGGVRLQGADHVIVSNVFRDLKQPRNYYSWPISLMAADLEIYGENGKVEGYGRARDILIVRNRFENCDHRIAAGIYPRKEYPLLPRHIHAVENVFTGMKAGSTFDYVAPDPSGELPRELHESQNEFAER
jgi:poly(beta-D-mannuronate) lyase